MLATQYDGSRLGFFRLDNNCFGTKPGLVHIVYMFKYLTEYEGQEYNPRNLSPPAIFSSPSEGTSILQSRKHGQFPARQPVQTARGPGRRHSHIVFIQAQLAVWNGQISLYFSKLYICRNCKKKKKKSICIVNIILSFGEYVLSDFIHFID